jgi:site-specific DNA-methyltransferase (adenine-specific)
VRVVELTDGFAVCADSTQPSTINAVRDLVGQVPLIVADPPYGNVLRSAWDRVDGPDREFASWMVGWTRSWAEACLVDGGAFYVWGGVGKPGFRPFLRYLVDVEDAGRLELANLITWAKKRAYGVQNNYLWTREECAYLVKGNAKKPRKFQVPLLEAKRGYSGFKAQYPAKSEHYRRTNVWSDITEMMQGKVHPAQKAQRVIEVPIEVHTTPGEYVVDPFAGSGTTALAARRLGRRFVVIESDELTFGTMLKRLAV